MSLAGADLGSGPGVPPSAALGAAPARRRWRSRWWWLLAAAALPVAAIVVLTVLAATYQPIAYGADTGIGYFPGLPNGKGLRWVNNLGGFSADLYVPPQHGMFTIDASIVNSGSRSVTIEAVTLLRVGGSFWPLTPAGPVRYYLVQGGIQQPSVRILRNVSLGPGQQIDIGIPVRTWPCALKDGWTLVSGFYVRERFLSFTHTVALPFGLQGQHLLMHHPGGHQGERNVFCASR